MPCNFKDFLVWSDLAVSVHFSLNANRIGVLISRTPGRRILIRESHRQIGQFNRVVERCGFKEVGASGQQDN